MKHRIIKTALTLTLTLFVLFLSACDEAQGDGIKEQSRESDEGVILIAAPFAGIDLTLAQLVEANLSEMGYRVRLIHDGFSETEGHLTDAAEEVLCVITAGREATEAYIRAGIDVPFVYCIADSPGYCPKKEGCRGVSPSLSSKSLADAALALVPEAEHVALISAAQGARDVQDACDALDGRGVDYTVEALEKRTYGEVLFAAAEKGSDVIILPSGDFSGGGIDLSPYEAAVIAVGRGEPVKGALASFCIDTEALCDSTVRLVSSIISGEKADASIDGDGCYVLCISEQEASRHSFDAEALGDDIRVVFVE